MQAVESGSRKNKSMQTIAQLEQHALTRLAERDRYAKALEAARLRHQAGDGGVADLGGSVFGWAIGLLSFGRRTADVAALEANLAKANASLKIEINTLHERHCEKLRKSDWYIVELEKIHKQHAGSRAERPAAEARLAKLNNEMIKRAWNQIPSQLRPR
jgi:hypothetical protein